MKTLTTTAVVAVMTAAIGIAAVGPTYAQDAAPPPSVASEFRHDREHGPRHGGPGAGGEIFSFERGAEAVEIALVRLSHAVDMTPEQQTLFDTLRTDALTAVETFTTTTEGLRPTPPAEGQTAERPDISTRFQNRIAMETAKLEALQAVEPAFTAFFDSLTDEQLADLMPQRPDRPGFGGPMGKGGPRPEMPAPAAPDAAPAAPDAAPAAPAVDS